MRVLFDQGVPVQIARRLPAHIRAEIANEIGWDRFVNGALLRAAENAGFDVLLTNDKNLSYQQNLRGRRIAIVVLGRNRWPLVQRVVAAVVGAVPGSYVEVPVPDDPRRARFL